MLEVLLIYIECVGSRGYTLDSSEFPGHRLSVKSRGM